MKLLIPSLPVSLLVSGLAGAAAPVTRVAPPSTPTPPPSAGADAPLDVNALLDRLETAGTDLRDFRADVAYQKQDELTGTSEFRYGRLVFDRGEVAATSGGDAGAGGPAANPERRIALLFDQYVDNAGRSDSMNQRYVFAGSWVCEIDAGRKQFIKRQVVAPGEEFDPLKIGEGPFPLPIGQKASDVRSRFLVTPAPLPTEQLLAPLKADAIHGLRLVPKPGTALAGDIAQVDIYYDRETLMPVGINTLGTEGGRRLVRLRNGRVNAGIPPEDRPLLSVEVPKATEWTVDIRPWQDPATAP